MHKHEENLVDRNYPRWKYKDGDSKLVQNASQESALGPEWTNSPAEVYEPPAPEPRKKHKSTEFHIDEFGLENQ